jgi:N-acetylmuramoyl-L-alanine amidase
VAFTGTPAPVGGEIVSPLGENFPCGLFSSAAMAYISATEEEDRELASLYNLALVPGECEAAVGLTLAPTTLAGVPISVDPTGVYIDADLSTATPIGPNNQSKIGFLLSSGLAGSYFEHTVLEQSFSVEAISTCKIFQLANQQGIPILSLDRTNWAAQSQNLALPSHVKASMANDIGAGYMIKTLAREITYLDWTGSGWMVTDPLTGAGSYLISGELSGGQTVEECDIVLGWHWFSKIDWVCITELKAEDPEFPDPEAAGKGDVLANAIYTSHISGEPEGGYSFAADQPTAGRFIMGSSIKVSYTSQMRFEGSSEVHEYKSSYTINTWKRSFASGGSYYSVIDLSTTKAAYNPYVDNPDLNPRIDFKLLPLLVEVPQLNGPEEGGFCVTTTDKYYRPVFDVQEAGGGKVSLDPEWKIELGDTTDIQTTEEARLMFPPIDFPPFGASMSPLQGRFTLYPFHSFDIQFPESAAGRYVVSAYEPNCTSRQYIYGEGWKDEYATDFTEYQHKVFFEMEKGGSGEPGEDLAGVRICLDPGHGMIYDPGNDEWKYSGASGWNGKNEAEFNWNMAVELKSMLEVAGATVILTRDEHEDPSLESRGGKATSNYHMFISIHCNASGMGPGESDAYGSMVFVPWVDGEVPIDPPGANPEQGDPVNWDYAPYSLQGQFREESRMWRSLDLATSIARKLEAITGNYADSGRPWVGLTDWGNHIHTDHPDWEGIDLASRIRPYCGAYDLENAPSGVQASNMPNLDMCYAEAACFLEMAFLDSKVIYNDYRIFYGDLWATARDSIYQGIIEYFDNENKYEQGGS